MRNILSFVNGTPVLGQEIIDWVNYQITNNTSHKRKATQLLRFTKGRNDTKPISPKGTYKIYTTTAGTGCGEIKDYAILQRVDKHKKKKQV